MLSLFTTLDWTQVDRDVLLSEVLEGRVWSSFSEMALIFSPISSVVRLSRLELRAQLLKFWGVVVPGAT